MQSAVRVEATKLTRNKTKDAVKRIFTLMLSWTVCPKGTGD